MAELFLEVFDKMHVPDWIVTVFYLEIENTDNESHLQEILMMCGS